MPWGPGGVHEILVRREPAQHRASFIAGYAAASGWETGRSNAGPARPMVTAGRHRDARYGNTSRVKYGSCVPQKMYVTCSSFVAYVTSSSTVTGLPVFGLRSARLLSCTAMPIG